MTPIVPVLSAGSHNPGEGKACFAELASWLRDEEWSDHPKCMHPVIAAAGRTVNDLMGDAERQRLLDLLPRALDTASDDPHLAVALAAWSAEQARRSGGPYASSASRAVSAALSVAHLGRLSSYAGSAASYAGSAAVYAVQSLHRAGADLYAFFSGLLDEYDRLTGRTYVELIPADRLSAAAEVAR